MKKQSRARGLKTIRQNRPNWRKKVVGHTRGKHYENPKKIKGKDWEKVKK